MKKLYVTPVLCVYGAVSKLTQQSDEKNADTPQGADNTAYSPGP